MRSDRSRASSLVARRGMHLLLLRRRRRRRRRLSGAARRRRPRRPADGAAAAAEAGQHSFLSKRDPTTKLPQQDYYDMERGAAEGGAEGGAAADADADADADDAEGGAASRQSLERMDVDGPRGARLGDWRRGRRRAQGSDRRGGARRPPKPLTPRSSTRSPTRWTARSARERRLSHPSVLKPAALGGYRPVPARAAQLRGGGRARARGADARPDNNFRMLDDELGAVEAEAAKRLMRDRGAGDVLLG